MTLATATEQARPRKLKRSGVIAALGLVPFGVYTFLFLGLPALAVVIGAFQSPDGGWTFSNISIASRGVYAHGFETTIELALMTSIVPGLAGVVIANAVLTMKRGSALRRIVSTASGVFANFGGVPLAFLFIASLGTTGIVTNWFNSAGLHIYEHGFTIYKLTGVAIVYAYFQIPLMILVITPALEGLRQSWREAATGLGARGWQYWRYVGGPVLFPSFLGGVLLLFGSALSAYATADALTSGSIALTSIQIGSFLNGNVLAGQQNVGKALGLGLIVVIAVVMVFYSLLQRRASRWLR
ncbi:MAG TPA: ABC transporter permease subunit [Acidimicrobiales bacterium]|jgi:putative spermidine/putrescine transport system permease protein